MSKTPLESVNEKYLMKRCKEQGFLCYKFTVPGVTGVPDRLVIANGQHVFIELKRPGGKLRPRQVVVHKDMHAHGAYVLTIDNKDDIDLVMTKLIAGEYQPTQP